MRRWWLALFLWLIPAVVVGQTVVFSDSFNGSTTAPRLQQWTPTIVGLRWELVEDSCPTDCVPFIVYGSGKVSIRSVASQNTEDPKPGGWLGTNSVKRIFAAIPNATTGPDQRVQYTLRELNNSSADDFWAVLARVQGAGTYYGAGWYHGSVANDCYLFAVVGNTYTQLATGECGLVSDGHVVALEVIGDQLAFSVDGAVKLTAQGGNRIDQAGYGGWGAGAIRRATDDFTEGESVDDFTVTDLGGSQPPPPPPPPDPCGVTGDVPIDLNTLVRNGANLKALDINGCPVSK